MRRLLPLVLACACVAPEPVGSSGAPIVDGTPATGEDATVLVKVVGGIGLCSGAMISESVVLTAKHCVQGENLDGPYPRGLVTVGVGESPGTSTDYRVRRIDTTPGAYRSGLGLPGLFGIDVGVITIRPDREGNFPDVEPLTYSRDDATSLVGETVTFVGFGTTPDGPSGRKLETTGEVDAVDGGVIYSTRNICSGDSGGPMIREGSPREIVGVASFGQGRTSGVGCPAERDGHNRIDTFLGMLDKALYEAGECPFVHDEVCDSVDNDCDDTIDEGCLAIGAPCTSDDECAFAPLPERFDVGLVPLPAERVTCEDTPVGRVCTRACDPLRPVESCATIEHPFRSDERLATPGAYCVGTGGCEGTCVAGERGALAAGEPCTEDAECATLACLDPGDGVRRCLTRCLGDAGSCPSGEVCAAAAGTCGGCVDAGLVAAARGLGEPCAEAVECVSGMCAGGACTRGCGDAECPSGFRCLDEVCVRGDAGLPGDPCARPDDCVPGHECTGGACTLPCTALGCADGFACEGERCVPATAVTGASCTVDDDCLRGRCVDFGTGGICTESCAGDGGCHAPLVCRRYEEGELLCGPVPEVESVDTGGGCSAGGAGGAAWAMLLLLAWRRRRT